MSLPIPAGSATKLFNEVAETLLQRANSMEPRLATTLAKIKDVVLPRIMENKDSAIVGDCSTDRCINVLEQIASSLRGAPAGFDQELRSLGPTSEYS